MFPSLASSLTNREGKLWAFDSLGLLLGLLLCAIMPKLHGVGDRTRASCSWATYCSLHVPELSTALTIFLIYTEKLPSYLQEWFTAFFGGGHV